MAAPGGSGEVDYRVGNVTAFFMLGVAFFLEGLQFFLTIVPIPIVGWLLSVLVGLFSLVVFGMWFLLLGVSIMGGDKAGIKIASTLTAAVVEILPLVGALPGTTIGILGMIIASRMEDKRKTSKVAAPTAARVRMAPRRLPQAANDNGKNYSDENDSG